MKIKTNQNLVSQNQNAQLKSPIMFVAITSLICTILAMDLLFFTYQIMTSLVLTYLAIAI
jgi:fatty-acid desaturase